jgi:uracil-DNA glycosylase
MGLHSVEMVKLERCKPELDESWQMHLGAEFDEQYMVSLFQFLRTESDAGKTIFPAHEHIFAALNSTPFPQVKVVILGQDPYPTPGHAHGLSFSVPAGVTPPRSLRNIFKEVGDDLGVPVSGDGCLLRWAQQGVLLLNAVLTVEAGLAGSHQGKGWEVFTDHIIRTLSARREHLVFLLWGNDARRKGRLIDRDRHLVLESAHPSPLSAPRGFFGNHHFSKANAWLGSHQLGSIDWIGS